MAVAAPCQTPGAVFHTEITPGRVLVAIDLPPTVRLDAADAAVAEAGLHNAVELVLAPYFARA